MSSLIPRKNGDSGWFPDLSAKKPLLINTPSFTPPHSLLRTSARSGHGAIFLLFFRSLMVQKFLLDAVQAEQSDSRVASFLGSGRVFRTSKVSDKGKADYTYQISSSVFAASNLFRVVYLELWEALLLPPFIKAIGPIFFAASAKFTTNFPVSFHGSIDLTGAM